MKLNVIAPTKGGEGAIRIQEFAVNGDPQPQLPAPANVTAVAGDGQVTLQWDAVSGADTYAIYKGTAPGSYDANPLDQVNMPGTSYMATGLTNGTTYYFAVTAGNAVSGASGYSNEASAMPRSGNADLSGLSIPFATLDPSFSAATYSYTASVPNSVGKIIVTPTAADSNATVTVNGSSAPSAVNLEVGANTINILVTAEDGISYEVYTVTVTRTSDVTLVSARSDGDGRTVLTFSEPLKPESLVPEAFLLRIGERPVAVTQVFCDPVCGDTVKLVASEPLFKWDRISLDVAGSLLQSVHGSWLAAIESRSVQTDTGALSPDFLLSGGVHLDGIMSYLQRRQFDIDANGDGSFDRADIEAMLAHIEP
ncbi:cadherin-like beta sandwich domain-containing protein [Paenibacillus cymbidii]|uniref:cadherin-like beta sandwich domain-containing protein n=1 Tax=Paenibacillus cymbidii TaxID=1639034 RepID=UPI00143684F9|nr:cadherin-like beta sandwich domain-containing protein [Paenibacillus cymbidii]